MLMLTAAANTSAMGQYPGDESQRSLFQSCSTCWITQAVRSWYVLEEPIIQGAGCIRVAMVVGIPKLSGVCPHHRRHFLSPERSVIAAGQNGEIPFQAEFHVEPGHQQLRHISARVA